MATRPPSFGLLSQLQVFVARRRPRRNELVMSTLASFVSVTAGLCFAAGLRSVAG